MAPSRPRAPTPTATPNAKTRSSRRCALALANHRRGHRESARHTQLHPARAAFGLRVTRPSKKPTVALGRASRPSALPACAPRRELEGLGMHTAPATLAALAPHHHHVLWALLPRRSRLDEVLDGALDVARVLEHE